MLTRANLQIELSRAWAAGFIDGEGFIGTVECTNRNKNGNHRWFSVVINMAQTRREVLETLQAIVGGVLSSYNDKVWGTTYQWRAYGPASVAVLEAVMPYLILKRRQAELALEFQKTVRFWGNKKGKGVRGPRLSPEVHIQREAIHNELRALNARRKRLLDAERASDGAPAGVEQDGAVLRSVGKNEPTEADRNDLPTSVQ